VLLFFEEFPRLATDFLAWLGNSLDFLGDEAFLPELRSLLKVWFEENFLDALAVASFEALLAALVVARVFACTRAVD